MSSESAKVGSKDDGPAQRFRSLSSDAGFMDEVVVKVSEGKMLTDLASEWRVPYAALARYVTEDVGRAERYARASRLWVDRLARETVALADELDDLSAADLTSAKVSARKLQTDVRFRMAAKLDRGTYGDGHDVNVNVRDTRTPLERDAALLETARNLGFVLSAADQVKRESAVVSLPAPVDDADIEFTPTPAKPEEPVI